MIYNNNNIAWIIIIVVVLLIIYIYFRNTENFATNTEAIENIASLYNSANLTATTINATKDINATTMNATTINATNITATKDLNATTINAGRNNANDIYANNDIYAKNNINAKTITSDYISVNGRINYVIPMLDWQGNDASQPTLTGMINVGGFGIGNYFNKNTVPGGVTELLIVNCKNPVGVFHLKLIKLLPTTYLCDAVSTSGTKYLFAGEFK
jgi:hypothetical protein